MNQLNKHEIFEIDTLALLKNRMLLSNVVFVGGTMLRLCYGLNRYSADLDFWFIREVDYNNYFKRLEDVISEYYKITDSKNKSNTILIEIWSNDSPRRLKIEMRKTPKKYDFQEKIAFSEYSSSQVLLYSLTPEAAMKSKIEAALSRKEIRDFYDIEFLMRRGVKLDIDADKMGKLKKTAIGFTDREFKVKLGSLLESDMRRYYIQNHFDYLCSYINI